MGFRGRFAVVYSSGEMIDQSCVALTLPELAAVLDPPMTEDQLRSVVALLGLRAAGVRRTGTRGRPRPAYDAREIMQIHSVLAPFLTGRV